MSGFGDEQWQVDVRTDLAVAIEQIPVALKELQREHVARLDFYEQGVQRFITMAPFGMQVSLECQSATSWQPEPGVIQMGKSELLEMLDAFLRDFVDRARERCPDLVEHRWFREWLREGSLG